MSDSTRSQRLCPVVAALVCISWLLMGGDSTRAVIISTGDGTGNTAAPIDDPGWANVGHYRDFTATYLGNRWAIAADQDVRGLVAALQKNVHNDGPGRHFATSYVREEQSCFD